jgi:ubiquinone/menaquinone biosynthesis C-methylase UbiE
MSQSAEAYFETRLAYDQKRETLWRTLVDAVFQPMIGSADTVLELGAGWCDFINAVQARRRIAVDLWSGVRERAAEGVEAHVASADELGFLQAGSVDLVFASNLLEHLTQEQVGRLLDEAARVLAPEGRLVLVQPNYRLCAKQYFDDYTHVSIWSDVSMAGYLESRGWRMERAQGRFLPLTVKSRLPVSATLIRAYLASPIKPLAGQMLLVARRPSV